MLAGFPRFFLYFYRYSLLLHTREKCIRCLGMEAYVVEEKVSKVQIPIHIPASHIHALLQGLYVCMDFSELMIYVYILYIHKDIYKKETLIIYISEIN